ncbi:lymphocyte activation gene 3 protein-like [Cololabis saira]|uniref:lymphocyte activation gene 3 protein-like n=1 Tax=Cololabis saira TaxID=129043 RepID=UPI002AD39C40|nr:lymphocyte activation gene 3 protein-like [Cololabis saira]
MMLLKGAIFGVITILMTAARCEIAELLVEVGSTAVLPCMCRVSPCHPAAIIWSKDSKGTVWRKERSGLQFWGSRWSQRGNPRVQCLHSQFDKGDYSLQISSVTEKDAGLYTCRMELTKPAAEIQVMLRIIQVYASPPVPMWGEKVSVTCRVTPWPKDSSVRWRLNNSPFWPEEEFVNNGIGSTIEGKASERLAGNLTCVVGHNKKMLQASITLSVRGIIQPPKDNKVVYAAVGSPFLLPCVFSPGLIPTSTSWKKAETGDLLAFNDSRSFSGCDKSLEIKEVTMEDQGKYKCSGSIKGQRLTRTMQLVIAKIVQSKKKGSVMLTCQLTDASEVTEYEWVRMTYDVNGTKSAGPVLKGQTVVLEGNWQEWTCCFHGREGLLGNVTYQVHLTGGLSGQKSSASSRNTGTVIGLSALLIVLLLVLAQMYKNHQRKKRIFQYPALETIVHTISNEREERERSRVKN